MLPPVVAGVDGTVESLSAAAWAAREALRRDRPLLLVYAVGRPPRRQEEPPGNAAQPHPARRVLSQAAEHLRRTYPGLRLCEEEVEGPAPAVLLQAAEQAELLVVGSHGLSGLSGAPVGSVAYAVVADTKGPVILVRAGQEAEDEHLPADDHSASTHTGYRDVVLGVDVADPCEKGIEFAFDAARLRRARLKAVYAWHAPSPVGLGNGDIGLVSDAQRADEWLGFLSAVLRPWCDKYPDVEVVQSVVADKASAALVRAAASASLLVLGRHPTGRDTGARTGPVTDALIRYIGCPLAVVPHADTG